MRIEALANRRCSPSDGGVEHLVRLRFTAPDAELTAVRTPVNVSLVMDRSGSMAGSKLEAARAAIDASVRMLRAEDRFSLVMFNSKVRVVCESTHANDEARLHAQNRVNRVRADGGTNLSGGWLEGAKQVHEYKGEGHLGRVLLATDGQANEGITNETELFGHARELRARGTSTSTIGIGHDFNESLLQGIAEQGGGNFYHVESFGQLTDLLTSELGEALQITVSQPRVELTVPEGAEVTLLNRFEVDHSEGGYAVLLDDLTSGQAVEISLLLRLPAAQVGREVALGFVIRGGVGRVVLASTAMHWTHVPAAEFEQAPRDYVVETAVAHVMLAQARREALDHNSARRFPQARQVLEQIAARLEPLAKANRAIRALLDGLDEEGPAYDADMSPMMRQESSMASFAMLRSRDSQGKARRGWSKD
ncbi:MAG: VWA domain-containing protein [Candidatus Eisenbacteria bacterium]